MPYTLKSEKVDVCGEQLEVFEASNLMDINRSMMIDEADKIWKGKLDKGNLDNGTEAQSRHYLETILYPTLVACTKGNIPTLEEFINMPASDALAWTAAARKLNSQWFPRSAQKTPEGKDAELEKNE